MPDAIIKFSPGRREFLKLSAAAAALASAGCTAPPEEIVPYLRPTGGPAGAPQFFATAMTLGGYASGLLVESNMGRPTKVEGNPAHPASLGATDVFAQASVLGLWDPGRSRTVRGHGAVATRGACESEWGAALSALEASGGEGLRILTGAIGSPTFAAQSDLVSRRFPAARWHAWEALHRDNSLEGSRLAFGRALDAIPRFANADVVLALDSDFLGSGPGHLRYAREFVDRRKTGSPMIRLYAVETAPSLAGAMADHRVALDPAGILRWLGELAAALRGDAQGTLPWAGAVASDLQSHHGRALIVAGETLPAAAHALVHELNASLGAPGNTVVYVERITGDASCTASIGELAADMGAGRVKALAVLGANPAYDAPAQLDFAAALARVPLSLHLGLYDDETAAACTWHMPEAHYLEEWSDARAFDGTACIVQPLIAPLQGGVSRHEVMALLAGHPMAPREAVRARWQDTAPGASFEDFWRGTLADGVIAKSAAPVVAAAARRAEFTAPSGAAGWTLGFRADPSVRDGAFANNAWLQELPRSDSKITWDNAAQMSAASAAKLGVRSGDIVEIAYHERRLRAPVWILPGHADHAITIALGYGRTRAGDVGSRVGVNAYPLRDSETPWTLEGVTVAGVPGNHAFATTQRHDDMEGRDPVRRVNAADRPAPARAQAPADSLYPPWSYDSYKWGMAIDLDSCIGCNACTIACQAENNIPTVGHDQVARGREMHWIRIDRYYEGPRENPRTFFQPVPCMQCEDAPCEVVCPVGATVHDSEGINVQVYNRCVGTRFCSNNCPYKVRRFNFLHYATGPAEIPVEGRNPEVTTRMRGVMEKCNYCLQRITRARIDADREGRRIADGEVVTACQAVCPTRAITFGDLNDPKSAVNAAKRSPLDYALLGELNTRPRTTYAARVLNPNPDAKEGEA